MSKAKETYEIIFSLNSLKEGDFFTTTVNTTGVEEGTRIFWSISGSNIDSSDIYNSYLFGSDVLDQNRSFSFTTSITKDLLTEGQETLIVKLFSDRKYTNQLNATSSINIEDTSIQPIYLLENGEEISIWFNTNYGHLYDELSFNSIEKELTISEQSEQLFISQTGIEFSIDLDDSAVNSVIQTVTDLTPLLDELTIEDKYLTYFSYTELTDNSAPLTKSLTYDPTIKAGARFYDLDGDGEPDTTDLKIVDGGYGDTDSQSNNIVISTSTAGVVELSPVLTATKTVLNIADLNDKFSPAALIVRASISTRADSVNQIGYVALNSSETETLTYELLSKRGSILLSNLENTDTPDLSNTFLNRDINLINGQKLIFFEIVDNTLESLLTKHSTLEEFGSSFRLLDLSNVTESTATASNGGNVLSLELVNGISDFSAFISNEMGFHPILDCSGLEGRNIEGTVSIYREANYDSTIGFYYIQNSDGAVLDSSTNTLLTPGMNGYQTAALANSNVFNGFGTLSTDDETITTNTINSFTNAGMLAPFATVSNSGETFFSFQEANTDGLNHFRVLGDGVLGLEDKKGGGDQDFDDLILDFNFQLDNSDNSEILAITDDDDPPTLSIADVITTNENAADSIFTVSLSEASSKDISFDYATSDGTATAGSDYTATSGSLIISAGETSGSFNIPVLSDLIDENNETVNITLSNATNSSFLDDSAIFTITDDDDPPTLSIADVITNNENAADSTFTVSLSQASSKDIS